MVPYKLEKIPLNILKLGTFMSKKKKKKKNWEIGLKAL